MTLADRAVKLAGEFSDEACELVGGRVWLIGMILDALCEAVAEEREACAKIADHVSAECRKDSDLCGHGAAGEVAQLIRDRA